jgi:hypothetical protein
MELKKCSNCGKEKSVDDFYRFKSKLITPCIACKKEYIKLNKDKLNEYGRDYYEKNRDNRLLYRRKYYKKNKDSEDARRKVYEEKNKDKMKQYRKQYRKEYYKKNKDRINENAKKWREKNPDKAREKNKRCYERDKDVKNEKRRARTANDNLYKLKNNLRSSLHQSLKRLGYTKKSKTCEVLGCDYDFLRNWLQLDLYNENSHIDHVVPLSLAKDEEDVITLNHYSNLQIISCKDNLSKKDKYIKIGNYMRVLHNHPKQDKIRKIVERSLIELI